jgi:hypothetical protein
VIPIRHTAGSNLGPEIGYSDDMFLFLDPLETESESLYDWRFTANQFFLAPSLLRLMARDLFLFIFLICNFLSDEKMGLETELLLNNI